MGMWRGGLRRSPALPTGWVALCVVGLVTAALTTACTSASGNAPALSQAPIDSNPVTEMIKPTVTVSAVDGAVGVAPGTPITVTVEDGTLTNVALTDVDGQLIDGVISPDAASWNSTGRLGYNRNYRIEAHANGLGGASSAISSFTTSAPGNQTKPFVLPWQDAVVGIGQPVAVQFDENIPDRRAAEEAITVVTTPPVEGAFYWVNNREVRWRPEHFWAPGTRVEVSVNTYGRDLGGGLFGQDDARTAFTIGDAVIAVADDHTKQVTIERNGEVIMTMPTSMGKDSTPTSNGVYIIGDQFDHMIMDSSTYGVAADSANGYRTPVDWATRMSYSGIFFHSAPWSVGDQGYRNVSHGCLNLSPTNAKWIFDNLKRGDIAIVKNTVGGTLSGTDGLGDWNIPWEEWKAGNASV